MESSPQRRCPQCGTPVAQKAETCLMCGAHLRERRKRRVGLPQGDLLLPLALVVAIVVLWLWKPWQAREPQAMAPARSTAPTPTPVETPLSSATYEVAPTATPLNSPTPPPTATLPPNQTVHTVESGETIETIAKKYGTTTKAILQANGLGASSVIHAGDELIIPLPVADTPTPTVTPTPSPTPFVYTIKSGETLSEIARRFDTTVEAIMEANGITDASRVRAGTVLTIVQPPDYTLTMAYETYEVQQGDTLYTIAAEYGLTVGELKQINNLEKDTLSVGQKLRIPVGTATPTPTLTPTLTPTPTPGPPRPAPTLLAPSDGASFTGADTVILLNWASVGILGDDEWYVIRLERLGTSAAQPPLVWTKATSWRIPADLYAPATSGPQRFRWQVVIMRHTGTEEDGPWLGEEISPTSGSRIFTWQ